MLRPTGFPPDIAHGNNLCAELRAPDSRILWAATPHFAVLTLARLRRNVKKPFLIKRTGTEFRNGTANTPNSRWTLTRGGLCIACSPRRCAFLEMNTKHGRSMFRWRAVVKSRGFVRCFVTVARFSYLSNCESTSARRIAMAVRSSRCRKLSRNIGLNNGNQRSMHKHVPLISHD